MHEMPSRAWTLRGFSFIELLVTLVLVTMLVALLMPVLKQVREAAQTVQCLSNPRQFGAVAHAYAVDSRDQLAPVWQQAYYFHHIQAPNLGVYYTLGYFHSLPLMFCASAPSGYGQIVPWHQGFSLTDYATGPAPFQGTYQTKSHQVRSVSAVYNPLLPEDPLNWIWDGNPAPGSDDDNANYSLRLSSATDATPLIIDLYAPYFTYTITRQPSTESKGHRFILNSIDADGSAIRRNNRPSCPWGTHWISCPSAPPAGPGIRHLSAEWSQDARVKSVLLRLPT